MKEKGRSSQTYFAFNKVKRDSSINLDPTLLPQVLWWRAENEATGVGTLEVVALDLVTGDSGYGYSLPTGAEVIY